MGYEAYIVKFAEALQNTMVIPCRTPTTDVQKRSQTSDGVNLQSVFLYKNVSLL